MGVPIATERRMLTDAEFETVLATHYPQICELSREDLVETTRRLRDYRDKARDVSRHKRREMRGKAEARGARPARDNTGTSIKKSIFAGALTRANRELHRIEKAEARPDQSEIARKALELKRANRVRHHPSAGRTAGQGMGSNPNRGPTVTADPREVGRMSQFVKAGQARRDAR